MVTAPFRYARARNGSWATTYGAPLSRKDLPLTDRSRSARRFWQIPTDMRRLFRATTSFWLPSRAEASPECANTACSLETRCTCSPAEQADASEVRSESERLRPASPRSVHHRPESRPAIALAPERYSVRRKLFHANGLKSVLSVANRLIKGESCRSRN